MCELNLNSRGLRRYSRQMQEDRTLTVSRISAETSASAALDEVCRWLIARQGNPVRLTVDDLPALGQDCWLRLALPISAPRAVLSALWLVAEMDATECLLVGHLRFVAHPTKSDLRLSFNGRTAAAIRSRLQHDGRLWRRPPSSWCRSGSAFETPPKRPPPLAAGSTPKLAETGLLSESRRGHGTDCRSARRPHDRQTTRDRRFEGIA